MYLKSEDYIKDIDITKEITPEMFGVKKDNFLQTYKIDNPPSFILKEKGPPYLGSDFEKYNTAINYKKSVFGTSFWCFFIIAFIVYVIIYNTKIGFIEFLIYNSAISLFISFTTAQILTTFRYEYISSKLLLERDKQLYDYVYEVRRREIEYKQAVLFRNSKVIEFKDNKSKELLKKREEDLEKLTDEKLKEIEVLKTKNEKDLLKQSNEIKQLSIEISKGLPSLAQAYSEFFHLQDLKTSDSLKRKSRPAYKASDEVRIIANQKRDLEYEIRIYKYKISVYEDLYPQLIELEDFTVEELIQIKDNDSKIEENDDAAIKWLELGEYSSLSEIEKYQRALDRYSLRRKSKWEIGREYERFVGFIYESKGYTVSYFGAIQGLSDLGRDLIIEKGKEVIIVQCKYWSKDKTIHEKHIFQLYGTIFSYRLENPDKKVSGSFVTSTKLSDTAKKYAKNLEIELKEEYPMESYPSIKCNISKRTGEKIYHLPFDQQYDKVSLKNKGEIYVATIKEAESLGFRRAKKWIPE
jgi:hypothetical protein